VRDNEEVTDNLGHIKTRSTHRIMATVILVEHESNQKEFTMEILKFILKNSSKFSYKFSFDGI